jgi:hypothetical protein
MQMEGEPAQAGTTPAQAGTTPAQAGTTQGWDLGFLASNAAQSAKATAAVEEEQAKSNPAKPSPTFGGWGTDLTESTTAQSAQPTAATAATAPEKLVDFKLAKRPAPMPLSWNKDFVGATAEKSGPLNGDGTESSKPAPTPVVWGKGVFPESTPSVPPAADSDKAAKPAVGTPVPAAGDSAPAEGAVYLTFGH